MADFGALRQEYSGCPLCGGKSEFYGKSPAQRRMGLTIDLEWMRCTGCEHVHTRHYWTPAGLAEVLKTSPSDQVLGGEIDSQREIWAGVIHRLQSVLNTVRATDNRGRWVDVGTGNGAFVFTASEFGHDAVGLDLRQASVDALRSYGYQAEMVDALTFDYSGAAVVVLADVLEHVPFPRALLTRIREGVQWHSALFVSCPNMDCVSWRYMDRIGRNHFWTEPEHHHNFTRESLTRLLSECGFKVKDYGVSRRYGACMEIIAT